MRTAAIGPIAGEVMDPPPVGRGPVGGPVGPPVPPPEASFPLPGGITAIAPGDGLGSGLDVDQATIHGGGVPSGVVSTPSIVPTTVGTTTPPGTGVAVGDGLTSRTGLAGGSGRRGA